MVPTCVMGGSVPHLAIYPSGLGQLFPFFYIFHSNRCVVSWRKDGIATHIYIYIPKVGIQWQEEDGSNGGLRIE